MTLSKERLEEIRDGRGGWATVAEEKEMARRLLAAEAQEPVAIVDIQSGRNDGNKMAIVFTRSAHALPDDVYNLYTAPPAPVAQPVQVPDEVLRQLLPDVEKADFWFEHEGNTFFEGVKFNDAVFEACRAAMLSKGVE